VRHHAAIAWEKKLKSIFDRIDDELEDIYGDRYPLHSMRARRGTTSNREHDGLFRIGAAFSAGFGSRHGRGYIVEIRMVTARAVSDTVRREIEAYVVARLREYLPEVFPGRRLQVSLDGHVYKIHGDLGLGEL
jgi:hypothetical protein